MKTARDPRHQARIETVKLLFAEGFTHQQVANKTVLQVYEKRDELDSDIRESAPAWPVDKLNRIDLAILRLAVYELKYSDTPPKVIIDEAVELAKRYGSENTPSFVNGVLGTIYNKYHDQDTKKNNE